MKSLNYYLDQEVDKNLRVIVSFITSIIFLLFGFFYYNKIEYENVRRLARSVSSVQSFIIILFFALIVFAFSIILNSLIKEQKLIDFIAIQVLIIASVIIRLNFLDSKSSDYDNFLSSWMEHLKNNGGFFAIKDSNSDYNVFYLYYLAFISYFEISSLYLIKFLSIFFDYVLALYVCKTLLDIVKTSTTKAVLSFFLVLFMPTVIINGSLWAQCDSIYVCFGIMSLYYGILNKPDISMVCFALCFASKLQAVFLLPILGILYIREKIYIKHFTTFIITTVLTILPAILLQASLVKILSVYSKQVGLYNYTLTLNAPTIYELIGYDLQESNTTIKAIGSAGVVITFFIVFAILYLAFKKKEYLNDIVTIKLAFLFVTIIPYLLPYMHERYFYFTAIFAIIFIFIYPKYFFVGIIAELGSFINCIHFIAGGGKTLSNSTLSFLMLVLIVFIIYTLFYKYNRRGYFES